MNRFEKNKCYLVENNGTYAIYICDEAYGKNTISCLYFNKMYTKFEQSTYKINDETIMFDMFMEI